MTVQSDLKKHVRARQAKTGESYAAARTHVLAACDDGTPHTGRVTGVVLKCNGASVRIRPTNGEAPFTLRCSGSEAMRVAPAQCIEVTLARRWSWRGDSYAGGKIERAWTDIRALGLEPLKLEDFGRYELDGTALPGPRHAFEFEAAAAGEGIGVDADDPEACLISEAVELAADCRDDARDILMRALLADPRCIDAHAHLGNWAFEHLPKHSIVHYEIGVAIGELSLGPEFAAMLPWGLLNNRPFLRALQGYGLCLWRLGQPERARGVFERILSLNPPDEQGVRFCLDDVASGQPWGDGGG